MQAWMTTSAVNRSMICFLLDSILLNHASTDKLLACPHEAQDYSMRMIVQAKQARASKPFSLITLARCISLRRLESLTHETCPTAQGGASFLVHTKQQSSHKSSTQFDDAFLGGDGLTCE